MSDKPLPPDPMGDDTRAAIVRDLIEWWSASPHSEIKRLSPAAIRQMAMEAGAFARGIMGEIAEIKVHRQRFSEGATANSPRYPLLWERGETIRSVPEDLARTAYAGYSKAYGTQQSFERLRERGGFGPSEMDRFVPGWRDDPRVKAGASPAKEER